MRGRCELCGRTFRNGRGYTQHINRCSHKLRQHSSFRQPQDDVESAGIYLPFQAEPGAMEEDEGIIVDDVHEVPLTEGTLRALSNGQPAEVPTSLC